MSLRTAIAPAAGWMVLLTLALAAAGQAASHADGVLLGLPSAAAAVAVLAGVALLAATGYERGRLALGLLPVPALLLLAPGRPGVRALTGPPLLALVLAVVVLVVARRGASWLPVARRAFFPVVLLVYVAVSLNVQRQVGAEGDEPHYLMVAESLWRDHDLALERDYAEGRYRAFYRTQPTLAPHYLVRGRQGEIYSQHALGLSLLVLPAYALGGYPAASLFMALLGALLARETRALLRLWTDDEALAEGLAWALALSPPLVHFAGLVFTEVPAALALAIGLRRLREPRHLSFAAALGVGAVLAFVPWLNVRYAPFPALLLLYALAARPRMALRPALALAAPSLLSAAASALYHFQLYGFFDPRRVYGRRPGFAWARLPSSLEALLLDQEFGLLVYAPLFALALVGLWALWRRAGWRHMLAVTAPIVVVLSTAATWRMWWGGWTPPARFLVPVVPALALLVAFALRRGVTSASALLMGWSLFLGLAAVPQPRLVHRDRDGTAPLLRAVSGAEEWTRLLPRFVLPDSDPERQRLALVWGLALAAALVASRRWRDSGARAPTAWGVAGVSLGLLLAADVAARASTGGSGGRSAVRVLGRPALELPAWHVASRAAAAWGPDVLGWGTLYEAHRFPAGAALGLRLPLPPGRYRLVVVAERLADSTPPTIAVVPDKSDAGVRTPLAAASEGWVGEIDVPASAAAVDLRLEGGGPLVLRGVRLELQPASRARQRLHWPHGVAAAARVPYTALRMGETKKNPSARSSQARKPAAGVRVARLAPAAAEAGGRPRSSSRRSDSSGAGARTRAAPAAAAAGSRATRGLAPKRSTANRVVARAPKPAAAAKGLPPMQAAPADADPRPVDPYESAGGGRVSEEETIESSKYVARAPRRFEEEHFLFPQSYGVNKVRLLVRDPQWLFAHWDVDPRSFDELRRSMGERVVALSRLTLRVHDALSGGASVVLLPFGTRSWYVRADATRRSYRAELGVTLPSGEFRLLAESNTVVMPRQAPSLERASRTVRYATGAAGLAQVAPDGAARAELEALAEPGPWQAPPPREVPPRPSSQSGTPTLGGASDLFQPAAPGAAAGGASDVFRR